MTDYKISKTLFCNRLASLGAERDAADLDTLYDLFTSPARAGHRPARSPEGMGKGDISKTLSAEHRALWQEPRSPAAGWPEQKHDHNKAFVYPWSEKARDIYFAKKADKYLSTADQLVLEHTPIRPRFWSINC